jgi:hypothetical protein
MRPPPPAALTTTMKVTRRVPWIRAAKAGPVRSHPERGGRLLQPSNQLASQPVLLDVFPYSDRIVDLGAVDLARVSNRAAPLLVEISRPWPPNEANALNLDSGASVEPNGRQVQWELINIFRCADEGRVFEEWVQTDTYDFLRQIGAFGS